MPPSQPRRPKATAPVTSPMLPLPTAPGACPSGPYAPQLGQAHNRAMSLAPPEAHGPLRRERLRTARLYFVCEALPARREPEALLHAALGGGVDIVQLREKELGRRRDRALGADLPPPLRHLQRPLHRQRRPLPGAVLRRRRGPRRPGRRRRGRGARGPRAGGDRRPLHPLRGAARGERRSSRSTT